MPTYNKKHLNASSATPVLVTDGALACLGIVNVGLKGASGNQLSIYDTNATGSTSTSNLVSTIDTTVPSGSLVFDCLMNTGIVVVLNGGTAAADVTIMWR